ncbi:hypothetical protein VB712_19215 [Spirulina sp. CCNP1310]|uniref:hypothetical protein n=1 Tax=Spirulina sp. CCNP1310 TaxID=3110249 RepID=UPI002B1FAD56|nr:hypothetical protein [Spirulina sp. CCNP1310]MEA5421360.1 hypothetical protein [Spirulina sp. CCNP1310]
MARKQMGTVKTPTGSEYYYFWDTQSGDVYVGSEHAGKAKSENEAWQKANYYATTCQKMK